jgi:hypothetical protein
MNEYTIIDTNNKLHTLDAINEEIMIKILKMDGISIKKILGVK